MRALTHAIETVHLRRTSRGGSGILQMRIVSARQQRHPRTSTRTAIRCISIGAALTDCPFVARPGPIRC